MTPTSIRSSSLGAALSARSSTRALLVVLVVTAAATVAAATRLSSAREAALASQHDFEVCRDDLRDLATWHATVRTGDGTRENDPELNRRVREAATAATLVDQLISIEPGPPIRVRDSDVLRTPIYLRLDGVTLRQLATFVHELTANDPSIRATDIECSTPPGATKSAGDERWTADVTLSESSLGPQSARLP